MKTLPLFLLLTFAATLNSIGQSFTKFNVTQNEDRGKAVSLHRIEPDQWIVTLFQKEAGDTSSTLAVQHYNNDFTQLLASSVIDSTDNLYNAQWFSSHGKHYIACFKQYNSNTRVTADPQMRIFEYNLQLRSFTNTYFVNFLDSLSFFGIHQVRDSLFLLGGLHYNPGNTLPWPQRGMSLQIIHVDTNFNALSSHLITHRNGLPTLGTITGISSLGEDGIAVACTGCKGASLNGQVIPTGAQDVALYDNQWNLVSNKFVFAEDQPIWPLLTPTRFTGPHESAGLVQIEGIGYVYYGDCYDSTHQPSPGILFSRQDVFLAKLDASLNTTQRTHFGSPNIFDRIPYSNSQDAQKLTLGGDGNLYTIYVTNLGSHWNQPDSVQKLMINCINPEFQMLWQASFPDSSDISGENIYSLSDGVYVLANSQWRGGEKFHVLRIDGTAWASSIESLHNNQWEVYPNPSNGPFYLRGENLPTQLYLQDISGRRVKVWPVVETDAAFSIEGLPPGLYFLRGTNQKGQHWPVKKLMIH